MRPCARRILAHGSSGRDGGLRPRSVRPAPGAGERRLDPASAAPEFPAQSRRRCGIPAPPARARCRRPLRPPRAPLGAALRGAPIMSAAAPAGADMRAALRRGTCAAPAAGLARRAAPAPAAAPPPAAQADPPRAPTWPAPAHARARRGRAPRTGRTRCARRGRPARRRLRAGARRAPAAIGMAYNRPQARIGRVRLGREEQGQIGLDKVRKVRGRAVLCRAP